MADFDYSMVATSQAGELRQWAIQVRLWTTEIGRRGWEIGDRLREARKLIPHGQWVAWLQKECGYSVRTAQRMIRLREAYDRPERITYSQTAAMILSDRRVPQAARDEAAQRSAAGENITQAKAQEIAKRHAPKRQARQKPQPQAQPVKDTPVVIHTTGRVVSETPSLFAGDPDEPAPRDGAAVQLEIKRVAEGLTQFKATPQGKLFPCDEALAALRLAYRLLDRPTAEADKMAARIYEDYPRKAARPVAIKAIRRAAMKAGWSELHAAVCRYAVVVSGADVKRIPHPATWFNQERWADGEDEWRRSCSDDAPVKTSRGISSGFDKFMGVGA